MRRQAVRLLWRFSVASLRNSSEFRTDFVTSIAHHLVYQTIFIVFWQSVIAHTSGRIGDWTFPDLAILSAFSLVATGVMQWFVGLLQLPAKVIRGDIDKYLCRPVSPVFALVAEDVNVLASVYQLSSALTILVTVCVYFAVPVSVGAAAAGVALLLLGCGVVLLVQTCVGLLSFWCGDVSRINAILMLSREFERYPLDLFPAGIRFLFVGIVPIGLISTYPVLAILGRTESILPYLGTAVGLLAVWAVLFRMMWRRALRRYESSGG